MLITPLRTVLDPESSLPSIELFPLDEESQDGLGSFEIRHQGAKVGKAITLEDYNTGERMFENIRVDSAYTGNRFGLATYVTLIELAHENDVALRNGESLTPHSYKIWQRFIEKGIAEVIDPLLREVIPLGDCSLIKYSGYVRVNPDLSI